MNRTCNHREVLVMREETYSDNEKKGHEGNNNRRKRNKRNRKKAQFIMNCGGWTIEKLGQIGSIYSGIIAVAAFLTFCSGGGLIKLLDILYSVCSICAVFIVLLAKAFINI